MPSLPKISVAQNVVYGDDETVADFVLSLLPHLWGSRWERFTALGVLHRGNLHGGVVYHDYNPAAGDIRLTLAFRDGRWCSRAIGMRLLVYPFRQLGCRRLTLMIGADNLRARAFAEHLGCKVEGVMRQAQDGTQDRIVYGVFGREIIFPGGPYG